jgi:cytochrome c-type biogenesis protein CcsB
VRLNDVATVITLISYGAAATLYLWVLAQSSPHVVKFARMAAGVGLAFQAIVIVMRGLEAQRLPFINMFEAVTFTAWVLVALYLILERNLKIAALGVFVLLIALIATAGSWVMPKDSIQGLSPVLRSHWSGIHVVSCLIAYASFILAFGAAATYVLQERLLKTKRMNGFCRFLPSLDVTDRIAYRMVTLGFPMLTLGVVTGALWASSAWGSYWQWDPKETWALVTWLVYAAYLHIRVVRGWHSRWANRLLVVGFGCVLITFMGVNLLPYGMHKYLW